MENYEEEKVANNGIGEVKSGFNIAMESSNNRILDDDHYQRLIGANGGLRQPLNYIYS